MFGSSINFQLRIGRMTHLNIQFKSSEIEISEVTFMVMLFLSSFLVMRKHVILLILFSLVNSLVFINNDLQARRYMIVYTLLLNITYHLTTHRTFVTTFKCVMLMIITFDCLCMVLRESPENFVLIVNLCLIIRHIENTGFKQFFY